jgi:type IX secretion system PorP/SprF family membrane protein
MFSRDDIDLNQLSFGISGVFIQSQLDETKWKEFDPFVSGTIVQKESYMNFDIGASYNYLEFYAHATVKNAVETRRNIYSAYESDNLRKLILSAGYTFGDADIVLWEPSIMFQSIQKTKESSIDFNLKAYKNFEDGKIWGGISYRRSLDGAQYLAAKSIAEQKLQYVSPIVGVNYKNFMFAYTYSQLLGDVRFDNRGFHQITIGLNLFCEPERYHCNCPAIN